jgi:hypothetical protein
MIERRPTNLIDCLNYFMRLPEAGRERVKTTRGYGGSFGDAEPDFIEEASVVIYELEKVAPAAGAPPGNAALARGFPVEHPD